MFNTKVSPTASNLVVNYCWLIFYEILTKPVRIHSFPYTDITCHDMTCAGSRPIKEFKLMIDLNKSSILNLRENNLQKRRQTQEDSLENYLFPEE